MGTLNTNYKVWINLSAIALLMLAVFGIIVYLRNVFRHVLIALLIIYMLSPFAGYLMRYGFTKAQAFGVVFLALFAIIIATVLFAGPKMMQEVDTAQDTWPQIERRIDQQLFRGVYDEDGDLVEYYIPVIDVSVEADKVQGMFFTLLTQLKAFVSGLIPALMSSIIIVPILTIILVKDRERMYRWFFGIVPNRYFEVVLSMAHDINSAIENFISAKAIQSIIVGAVCCIGFLVAGVKVPLLMGILVALFNIVPYIGPLLGAAPPIVISYLLIDTRTAIIAAIIIIIAQVIDNLFTQPVLLPKLVNEHPVVVILVTLIGAELFGALGLVLGIAVYGIVKIIFVKSYEALDVIYSREN